MPVFPKWHNAGLGGVLICIVVPLGKVTCGTHVGETEEPCQTVSNGYLWAEDSDVYLYLPH